MSKLNHIQVSGQNLSLKKGLTVGSIFLYITKMRMILTSIKGHVNVSRIKSSQGMFVNMPDIEPGVDSKDWFD